MITRVALVEYSGLTKIVRHHEKKGQFLAEDNVEYIQREEKKRRRADSETVDGLLSSNEDGVAASAQSTHSQS